MLNSLLTTYPSAAFEAIAACAAIGVLLLFFRRAGERENGGLWMLSAFLAIGVLGRCVWAEKVVSTRYYSGVLFAVFVLAGYGCVHLFDFLPSRLRWDFLKNKALPFLPVIGVAAAGVIRILTIQFNAHEIPQAVDFVKRDMANFHSPHIFVDTKDRYRFAYYLGSEVHGLRRDDAGAPVPGGAPDTPWELPDYHFLNDVYYYLTYDEIRDAASLSSPDVLGRTAMVAEFPATGSGKKFLRVYRLRPTQVTLEDYEAPPPPETVIPYGDFEEIRPDNSPFYTAVAQFYREENPSVEVADFPLGWDVRYAVFAYGASSAVSTVGSDEAINGERSLCIASDDIAEIYSLHKHKGGACSVAFSVQGTPGSVFALKLRLQEPFNEETVGRSPVMPAVTLGDGRIHRCRVDIPAEVFRDHRIFGVAVRVYSGRVKFDDFAITAGTTK